MIVVLDNIRSALNVGSVFRTCDAFSISDVYLCGITPGIENRKVTKTSLGAEKNLDIKIFATTKEAVLSLKKTGYLLYGLEIAKNAKDIGEMRNMTGNDRVALVVGNEVSGISDDILGLCDLVFQIPMRGIKESLNVAVAFGIAIYALKNN
jgi:23S rRNA (guanosine2251-2'-O)-methyltransferase